MEIDAKHIIEDINKLVELEKITPDNAMNWITFARIIKAHVDTLEERAKDVVDAKTENIIAAKKMLYNEGKNDEQNNSNRQK